MTLSTGVERGTPAGMLPSWIERQTLKTNPIPGYNPADHSESLDALGSRLLADHTIAAGKLNDTLNCLLDDPTITRAGLTEQVFNGNSGYTLQIIWPLVAIFAARIPRKVSPTTAHSYVAWVDRIRRVVLPGLSPDRAQGVEQVLDIAADAFAQAVSASSSETAGSARGAETASERVDTNEPGIYVFTTPTYLAYPPFGLVNDDLARQDFRYLKTGSTSVDVSGRVQSEIRRQTGLPEPYVILARFTSADPNVDYIDLERTIHRILGEARHGPEEDGTRRSSSRGAGTEWFVTRLPFVIAVAESLGLVLSVSEELKDTMSQMLEDCDLLDWSLG